MGMLQVRYICCFVLDWIGYAVPNVRSSYFVLSPNSVQQIKKKFTVDI